MTVTAANMLVDNLATFLSGNTPLLEACSQGHVTVARLLLDRGAEIDAPTGLSGFLSFFLSILLRFISVLFSHSFE